MEQVIKKLDPKRFEIISAYWTNQCCGEGPQYILRIKDLEAPDKISAMVNIYDFDGTLYKVIKR